MASHSTALLSVVAVSALLLGTVSAADGAMERSQWREHGFKPPPPIGTDDVHPRKPFDQDRIHCTKESDAHACRYGRDVPVCRPLPQTPANDRSQH